MKKTTNFLIAHKPLFVALFFTLTMVLYAQFVLGHFSECFRLENGPNSLGLTFGYSYSEAFSFFHGRDPIQLLCYGDFIRVWDSIFAVVYTIMHIFWLRYFFKAKPILLLFPIAHMCMDWCENYTELMLLHEYFSTSNLNTVTVKVGSMLTSFKWVFSGITYVLVIYGIFIKIRDLMSAPKQN